MKKIQRHTQARMFAHVEACKENKLPQKQYCKQQGIAYSTFLYWAKKYRISKAEGKSKDVPGFIPIRVQMEERSMRECNPGQLQFLFPNGITLICSERVHPGVLKKLLSL